MLVLFIYIENIVYNSINMQSDSFHRERNSFEENLDLSTENLEVDKNQDVFAEKALARLDEILFSHEKLEAHYSGSPQKEPTFERHDYSAFKINDIEELSDEDASRIADSLRNEGITINLDSSEEINDWNTSSL